MVLVNTVFNSYVYLSCGVLVINIQSTTHHLLIIFVVVLGPLSVLADTAISYTVLGTTMFLDKLKANILVEKFISSTRSLSLATTMILYMLTLAIQRVVGTTACE